MKASFILSNVAALTGPVMFLFAWLHCEEKKVGVWELYASHTPHPFITVSAPKRNWTWDIRMGSADARCILKLVLSHWTLSQGCHVVMHYAYMQIQDKEMDDLKGHLWFPAQRYTQQGKWGEHSYHLVDAQLYGEMEKHSQTLLQFKCGWWLITAGEIMSWLKGVWRTLVSL